MTIPHFQCSSHLVHIQYQQTTDECWQTYQKPHTCSGTVCFGLVVKPSFRILTNMFQSTDKHVFRQESLTSLCSSLILHFSLYLDLPNSRFPRHSSLKVCDGFLFLPKDCQFSVSKYRAQIFKENGDLAVVITAKISTTLIPTSTMPYRMLRHYA